MLLANAVVSSKRVLTSELIILRVRPDGWELPVFVPGQFCVLGLPETAGRLDGCDPEDRPPDPDKWIRRAYSIASSSCSKEYVEVYANLVRSGALTPRLFALGPGDRLHLGEKISGLFGLRDVPLEKNIVMIATGTGLAPYMSMIRTHLTGEDENLRLQSLAGPGPLSQDSISKSCLERRFAVIHGARRARDLGYLEELRDLERSHEHFIYLPVVSRVTEEPGTWDGLTGHVQDVWNGGHIRAGWGFAPEPAHTHVFLCGNPAMVEDLMKILASQGYKEHSRRVPGEIHVERYW